MGDIPFGVSYYSADVFSRPDEFVLDRFGGAPPEPLFKDDAFTQKWGQNWGIPLYRWTAMRATNFQWWRERVRAPDGSFICSGSITSRDFIGSMPFPWRPERNREFLPVRPASDARTNGRSRTTLYSAR